MPHLFKYVTPDTGRKIIETRTLRWSTPPTLNDPFDMQFAFQLRVDRQAARARALEKQWEHYYGKLLDRPLNDLGRVIRQVRDGFPRMSREEFDGEIGDSIDESIDRTESGMARFNAEIVQGQFANDKILCLSDIPDSILMWSYYAQNHAGMVLRFTDETPDNPLAHARPVRYVDQLPSLFDDETLSDMLAGYDGMDTRRIIDEIVWTKSSHWAHEREWRVYTGRGRSDGSHEDVPFNPRELDGVIFGVRTTEAERTALTDFVRTRYPHVELLQAKARTDAYGLAIESASELAPSYPGEDIVEGIPRLTNEGTMALLFSVILSLDKRGLLKRRDFIADLGEVIEDVRKTPFLSQTAADELSRMYEWLARRQSTTNAGTATRANAQK